MVPSHEEALEERARALRADALARLERSRPRAARPPRPSSLAGLRLRTLLLPAFAIACMAHFGGGERRALPGVSASFTPGAGASFAGARTFEADADAPGDERVPVHPGDVIGVAAGAEAASRLDLAGRTVRIDPGARALVASLFPPRVRLVRGGIVVSGDLVVDSAHGIVDLAGGSARITLESTGLAVTLVEGSGRLVGPDGAVELVPGRTTAIR